MHCYRSWKCYYSVSDEDTVYPSTIATTIQFLLLPLSFALPKGRSVSLAWNQMWWEWRECKARLVVVFSALCTGAKRDLSHLHNEPLQLETQTCKVHTVCTFKCPSVLFYNWMHSQVLKGYYLVNPHNIMDVWKHLSVQLSPWPSRSNSNLSLGYMMQFYPCSATVG